MDRGQKTDTPGIAITIIVILVVIYVGWNVMGVFADPERMCSDAYGEEWGAVPNTTPDNGTYYCLAENGTQRNLTIRNLTNSAASAGAIPGGGG